MHTESIQDQARSWQGYVIPMGLFVLLTALEGSLPKTYYPWFYFLKVVLVGGTLLLFRQGWKDLRFEARVIVPGILVGLAVLAEWILVENNVHYPHLGSRVAYDPFVEIADPTLRVLFIAVRLLGLAALVPVVEELFWRSFLLRYLTRPEFENLPLDGFSWGAFAMVAGGFALAHSEWLAAVICAIAYGLLLRQTRSVFACVVAHATTNLLLGLYVLTAHQWRFW